MKSTEERRSATSTKPMLLFLRLQVSGYKFYYDRQGTYSLVLFFFLHVRQNGDCLISLHHGGVKRAPTQPQMDLTLSPFHSIYYETEESKAPEFRRISKTPNKGSALKKRGRKSIRNELELSHGKSRWRYLQPRAYKIRVYDRFIAPPFPFILLYR